MPGRDIEHNSKNISKGCSKLFIKLVSEKVSKRSVWKDIGHEVIKGVSTGHLAEALKIVDGI
jgi:hypothetical protein